MLNDQGQNYMTSLTHDAFVGMLQFTPSISTAPATASSIPVQLIPTATAGNDFKATDWAAVSSLDTGQSTEYTPTSPATSQACDEVWTLDTPTGQGADV